MKILLLDEFSGFHKNLKEGLIEFGHEAVLASNGDGWKKIQSDINWESNKSGVLGFIHKAYKQLNSVVKMTGFDVVQMIRPVIFTMKYGLNDKFLKYIFDRNEKVFLVGAGATTQNTLIARFFKKSYKYPHLYSEIYKDSNGTIWSETADGVEYNKKLLDSLNGYIPIMYEYAQGYRDVKHEKLCSTIPIPMNIDKVKYKENKLGKKVVFFHGINQNNFKGTPLIKEAMEKLKKKYPNDVEIIIDGKLPLDKYLALLDRVNVVVDQTYSVSYGLNVIYSMALGKVAVGGGEEDCLREFGLKNSPIVPIKPMVEDIELHLARILENKFLIPDIGYQSRRYVEQVHDYRKIAEKFIEVWRNN